MSIFKRIIFALISALTFYIGNVSNLPPKKWGGGMVLTPDPPPPTYGPAKCSQCFQYVDLSFFVGVLFSLDKSTGQVSPVRHPSIYIIWVCIRQENAQLLSRSKKYMFKGIAWSRPSWSLFKSDLSYTSEGERMVTCSPKRLRDWSLITGRGEATKLENRRSETFCAPPPPLKTG